MTADMQRWVHPILVRYDSALPLDHSTFWRRFNIVMRYERNITPPSAQVPQSGGSVPPFAAPEMAPRPDSHAHKVIPKRYIALYTRGMGVFFVAHLAYLIFLRTRSDV